MNAGDDPAIAAAAHAVPDPDTIVAAADIPLALMTPPASSEVPVLWSPHTNGPIIPWVFRAFTEPRQGLEKQIGMTEIEKREITRERRREGPQEPKTSASTERTPEHLKNPVNKNMRKTEGKERKNERKLKKYFE